jgi:hypothetical protein
MIRQKKITPVEEKQYCRHFNATSQKQLYFSVEKILIFDNMATLQQYSGALLFFSVH